MLRVPYQELFDALHRVLLKVGFEPERAELSARLFADSSCDGVPSHGLNRFPLYIQTIHNGCMDIHARPERVASCGSMERWDGKRGPGNLNAHQCMGRTLELAREHGIGCVALANTNHWLRGASYGWQAAEAGAIAICWTNTLPNLPPWGSGDPLLGNNPLVIAVPRVGGHVVLDMALSQFSYGALANHRRSGKLLAVDGGFDAEGRLTRDPSAIENSRRPLPIGYWKGSALALALDMVAAILSGGQATFQIATDITRDVGISQVFIAMGPSSFAASAGIADEILANLKTATPSGNEPVRYPGQQTLTNRTENLEKGVPVDPSIWSQVQAM